jgi:energy-converting hydrogenase Eha subunit H
MSAHILLTLPILFPLLGVALCALFWSNKRAQRVVSLLASFGLLGSALALMAAVHDGTVLATHFGNWDAPFGIVFVADMFAAAMVLITGIMAVAIGIYGLAGDIEPKENAFYHLLYQGLLLGVTGAFLTGDIFNLYVWFEIMLISSFGLLALGEARARSSTRASSTSRSTSIVDDAVFLITVAFLYGITGTLNMADLARVLPTLENQGLVATLADPVPDRIRREGSGVPALLLAAGRLSHRIRADRRDLRGAAHQGRRLRHHPHLHAAVRRRRPMLTPDRSLAVHRHLHYGHRRARRGGALRRAPHPVVPHHQPDRLHAVRHRRSRRLWPSVVGALRHPSHRREGEPVPRSRA